MTTVSPPVAALPVVRTMELGGGALSRALQTGSAPAHWTMQRPGNAAEWSERAGNVRAEFTDRDWLAPLASAFAASGAAAERLQAALSHGVVVTTGQQPGLFGGPAYTWSKAIAALALADELQEQLNMPVAPVFWAATDDADWREAATTYVVTAAGLEALTMPGEPSEAIALAEVSLGDVEPLLATLQNAAGSAAHADALELAAAAYAPDATVGGAYVQLLRGILEPLGIAVLDAAHPAVRRAADPLLRAALAAAPAVAGALRTRVEEIRAAGLAPQVDEVPGLSLVFRTTTSDRGNTRERLPVAGAARAAEEAEPGSLGANVLLRPVLERALLPTVAYLAGPGEFAYFAQVGPIAGALHAATPLAVPRWSGTLLEPHIARLLERLDVDEAEFDDPHGVESRLAKAALDDGIADAVERARLAAETQLRALQVAVAESDGLVAPTVIDGTSRDITHRLDRLERRLVAGVKRREAALMRDLAVARAALRPLGKSPERVLNLLPVLARYGPEVLDSMRESARVHARALVGGSMASAP